MLYVYSKNQDIISHNPLFFTTVISVTVETSPTKGRPYKNSVPGQIGMIWNHLGLPRHFFKFCL